MPRPIDQVVRDSAVAATVAVVAVAYLLWTLVDLPTEAGLRAIADLVPLPVKVLTCLCLLRGAQKAEARTARRWGIASAAYALYLAGDASWAWAQRLDGMGPLPLVGDISYPMADLVVLATVAVLALQPRVGTKDDGGRVGMLRTLATTDPLTGLANRRHFSTSSERVLEHAGKNGDDVSLLMIEVDFFSSISDVYGRLAGNEAMVAVSAVVGACIRPHDLVGRYSGDELVVLTERGQAEAVLLATRIRVAMSAVNLVRAPGRSMSLSIGIATTSGGGTAVQELLNRSEKALVEAKRAGRDCEMVAADERSVRVGQLR